MGRCKNREGFTRFPKTDKVFVYIIGTSVMRNKPIINVVILYPDLIILLSPLLEVNIILLGDLSSSRLISRM